MRSIAKVLLSVGAVILIYCCCIMARAQLYQAYEDWTFDRILRKSGTSVEPPPDSPLRLDGEHRHPAPKLYSLIGRIEIPRLGLSTMILEGDEERELLLGAGHVP